MKGMVEFRFYKLVFINNGDMVMDFQNCLRLFLPQHEHSYEPYFIENLDVKSAKYPPLKNPFDRTMTTDRKLATLLGVWLDERCQYRNHQLTLDDFLMSPLRIPPQKVQFWGKILHRNYYLYTPFIRTCDLRGLTFDPLHFNYFYSQLISHRKTFRHLFENAIRAMYQIPTTKDADIFIYLRDSFVCPIDFIWNKMLEVAIREKIELEYALSWLSTLGGAFSAMGDVSANWAVEAGIISFRQLKIAMKLDDPLIASRCRLYAAISLMQQGYNKSAKQIVKKEYKYATSLPEDFDPRLIRMCKGVWAKLQYHWKLKGHSRKLN